VELAGYLKTGEIETIEIPDDSQIGQSAVEIYPNPAKEKVNIIYPYNGSPVTLSMVSIDGKTMKIFTLNNSETIINVQDLKPGVYILRMETNEDLVIKRLVIQ
jgi:hypothetical protein